MMVERSFDGVEEAMLAVSFPVFVVIYNGLYDTLPFLLAMAISAILAYSLVLVYRGLRTGEASFRRHVFVKQRMWTFQGKAFIAVFLGMALFTVHGGLVQYHTRVGRAQYNLLLDPSLARKMAPVRKAEGLALWHLESAYRLGLYQSALLSQNLASLSLRLGLQDKAERYLQETLEKRREDIQTRLRLASMRVGQGRSQDAAALLEKGLLVHGNRKMPADNRASSAINGMLASILLNEGDRDGAMRLIGIALELDPGNKMVRAMLEDFSRGGG